MPELNFYNGGRKKLYPLNNKYYFCNVRKLSPKPICVIMKKQLSTEPIFIDPVCLKAVTDGKRDSTVTYRFRTYYFCKPSCRKAFEMNPDRYLNQNIVREKGSWRHCLDRLKQVSGYKIF